MIKPLLAEAANNEAAALSTAAIEGSKHAVNQSYDATLGALDSVGRWPIISDIANLLGPFAKYVGAFLVFLIAWKIICPVVRGAIISALGKTSWDEKLSEWVGNKSANPARGIAQFFYYLLLLFFAVLSLDIAGLNDVTAPLQGMLNQFLSFIPGLVGASLLLFIAVFVGRIVKNLIATSLNGLRLDERIGSSEGTTPVSNAIAGAVFWLFILLILPAVLQSIQLGAIADPIIAIVGMITSSIPNIILAAVLLAIGFLVAEIARKLVTNVLVAIGVDAWPSKIGLDIPSSGPRSVSNITGYTLMVSIIVLLASTAINTLQIGLLEEASRGFVTGYFRILLAVLIFGAGLLLSRWAYSNLSDKNALLAQVARIVILVLTAVAAIHRSQIIPPELVKLPYDAFIIAAAVALGLGGAVAIGIGGKDTVARILNRWFPGS
ncbi:MAG: mechanosensitive ion channel [Chthoniobacterales bacterium]